MGGLVLALALGALARVAPAELCVTHGAVMPLPLGRLGVFTAAMRAVVAGPPARRVALRFTYLGPSPWTVALRSGAMRRQIGVKLRARDGCNVVYLMWRLAPAPSLVAQVKRNPGERTNEECENRGYATVAPRRVARLPEVRPGSTHVLAAELRGDELVAEVDGEPAWEGDVGEVDFDGPVGVRSDNGWFAIDLYSEPRPAGAKCP